jgi:GGDEF domain-containing protein
MAPSAPRRRRARPVADAPIEVLLPRAADLAKGWLLALVEDAPLSDAPALLGAGFPNDGPRLCEAVLRALVDDRELHRLRAGGPLGALAASVGDLAAAGGDAAATVRSVDALAAVLWAALRAELADDDGAVAIDVAERLAAVCAVLRVAALERLPEDRGEPDAPGAVPDAPAAPAAPAPSPPTDALWIDALQQAIAASPDSPLALLLVELEDAERVVATESALAATAAFEHFGQAVRGAVRPQDILVSETDGRAWIMARDTARPDAHALAARVAEAVGSGAAWRGAPLIASVGMAVLHEDGLTADELIDVAEETRFAAAASGTDIAP